MEKHTTLAISQESNSKLGELAKKYNLSKKELAENMIEYFYRTGHDPADLGVEGSTEAIKKLDKRVISFIRKMEQDKLVPMVERVELVNHQLQEFLAQASTKEHIKQLVENQKKLRDLLEKK